MVSLTVLYGHPKDVGAFERHYADVHVPLAKSIQGVIRLQLTHFGLGVDDAPPAFHRMAELHFETSARMQEALESAAGQATAGDIANFATGGATMLVGKFS